MKNRRIITLIAIIAVLITIFYSFRGSQDDAAYAQQIEKERMEKDRFMRSSPESPFASSKQEYDGLKFYPPDIKYRVIARLEPVERRRQVILTTNDGKEQQYLEYAYAHFKIDGVSSKLLILEIADVGESQGKLFLAFGDETSGVETYGAGRYLDLNKAPGSSTIKLDFNLAYNPYCAYNDSYSCPLPPRENLLSVPIRAGEKIYRP